VVCCPSYAGVVRRVFIDKIVPVFDAASTEQATLAPTFAPASCDHATRSKGLLRPRASGRCPWWRAAPDRVLAPRRALFHCASSVSATSRFSGSTCIDRPRARSLPCAAFASEPSRFSWPRGACPDVRSAPLTECLVTERFRWAAGCDPAPAITRTCPRLQLTRA
jgi:hypothetical protein